VSRPDRKRWPSQKARLLAWALPGRAIRQREWMRDCAPDLGPPITRVAAIVGFLEDDGHCFHHRAIAGGMVEYVYAGKRPPEPLALAAADVATFEQPALFDPPRTVASFHDWEDDGAA
jgi:hypothetical protein